MSAQPGPWTEDRYGGINDAQGKTLTLRGVSLLLHGNEEEEAIMRANRRLVIAAPDMRDVLRRFVNRFRIDPQTLGYTSENVYVLVGEAERLLKQVEEK